MININSMEQFEEVVKSDKISVVVFSADWCGDCIYLKTFLDDVVKENSQYQWVYADREKNIEIAKFHGIFGIPSFLAFKSGEKIADLVGKERKTRAMIEKFLSELK